MDQQNDFNPEGQKRGPGRPRKVEAEAQGEQQPANTRADAVKRERRRRDDLGEHRNLKLGIPEAAKDPNYTYRWLNDTAGGRIHDKTRFDDWDIVTEEQLGGMVDVSRDGSEGSQVKRRVGVGEDGKALFAYLCRKPKEFHEEDSRKAQRDIDDIEESMRRGPLPGGEGLKQHESYVPGGRNTIKAGT